MPGQISISGTISGVPAGVIKPGPYSIPANEDSNLEIPSLELLAGDNTIAIPSWAVGVVIIPPTGNTEALTLKGASADTGITISPNQPNVITFPSSPQASFFINAADDTSAQTQFIFF